MYSNVQVSSFNLSVTFLLHYKAFSKWPSYPAFAELFKKISFGLIVSAWHPSAQSNPGSLMIWNECFPYFTAVAHSIHPTALLFYPSGDNTCIEVLESLMPSCLRSSTLMNQEAQQCQQSQSELDVSFPGTTFIPFGKVILVPSHTLWLKFTWERVRRKSIFFSRDSSALTAQLPINYQTTWVLEVFRVWVFFYSFGFGLVLGFFTVNVKKLPKH